MVDQVCTCQWGILLLHLRLLAHCKGLVLRLIQREDPIVEPWCSHVLGHDGNSILGLRIAIRTDELLGRNSHHQHVLCYTLGRPQLGRVFVGWV